MNEPPVTEATTRESLSRFEEQIRRRLTGRVRDFQLVVRDRGLVLRGRSRTYHAKQLAQHAVMEIAGLPIRANEIEVRIEQDEESPIRPPRSEPLPERSGGDIGEPRGEARRSFFARMAAVWSRNRTPGAPRERESWGV